MGYLGATLVLLMAALPLRAETLNVELDWSINPDHAPLVIALEKGYFSDAGLDVALIAPEEPNAPPKLVAGGQATLAISYQPQLQIAVAKGQALVRIGTLIATPLDSVLVLKDGPVASLADLKGRKIGYSVKVFEEALLSAMLATASLTLDDVTMVNVDFKLVPALLNKEVDAVIGAFRNYELLEVTVAGSPGRAFFVEDYGVPIYDELIIVAHRDKLDDPRLVPFLEAVQRAVLFMVNHPQEAWQTFSQYKSGLDSNFVRLSWDNTLARFALRPAALEASRYETFARFLKDRGVIDQEPPLQQYAVELL